MKVIKEIIEAGELFYFFKAKNDCVLTYLYDRTQFKTIELKEGKTFPVPISSLVSKLFPVDLVDVEKIVEAKNEALKDLKRAEELIVRKLEAKYADKGKVYLVNRRIATDVLKTLEMPSGSVRICITHPKEKEMIAYGYEKVVMFVIEEI